MCVRVQHDIVGKSESSEHKIITQEPREGPQHKAFLLLCDILIVTLTFWHLGNPSYVRAYAARRKLPLLWSLAGNSDLVLIRTHSDSINQKAMLYTRAPTMSMHVFEVSS